MVHRARSEPPQGLRAHTEEIRHLAVGDTTTENFNHGPPRRNYRLARSLKIVETRHCQGGGLELLQGTVRGLDLGHGQPLKQLGSAHSWKPTPHVLEGVAALQAQTKQIGRIRCLENEVRPQAVSLVLREDVLERVPEVSMVPDGLGRILDEIDRQA